MPGRVIRLLLFIFLAGATAFADADAQTVYRTPPSSLAALVDAPATPSVAVSPDGRRLIEMTRQGLPGIADVSRAELRLAGIRIDPATGGRSRQRYTTALTLVDLADGSRTRVSGVPLEARLSSVRWSPSGERIAFTHTGPDRITLWVAGLDGRAHQLLDSPLNALLADPFHWMPDGTAVLAATIDPERGAAPEIPSAPAGPVIQESDGKAAPARTYQDLLASPYDAALFEYHARAALVLVALDGGVASVGAAGMLVDYAPSPDGRYVLVEAIHRPFSYLVPYRRFPRTIDVMDTAGSLVHRVADLPLAETVPTGFGSVTTGVRSIEWRPDADATLVWAEALDGGDARAEVVHRDAVYLLAAPFEAEPIEWIRLPLRFGGAQWSDAGFGLVRENWWATRTTRTYRVDDETREASVLFDRSYEDRYTDPGNPQSELGSEVLQTTSNGRYVFLIGTGASEEGNRPFFRRLDLETGQTKEYFRSAEPYYEFPIAMLPDHRLLTRRESADEPPNYFVRHLDDESVVPVTHFPHPYPDLTGVQKEFIVYTRPDGVQLSATLYLPPGYDAAVDGPLPTLVWAYPREFKSADAAGQISGSPYRFKGVSYWGPVPFVTRGYAVLDGAAMPVIGEDGAEPNDSFVRQLVMNAQAVINEGARRGVVDPRRVGVGGHSYGAFMTANLLAHSDLFKAGIARSGAYNRTLTPFGFQSEERTYWEAPEIYYNMSPFMHADDVNEPLLMIHGQADNNSGTFPIQSERMYHAIQGLGGHARLVMLPNESHGYRARESILHMLWEESNWLDAHVRDALVETPVSGPTGR